MNIQEKTEISQLILEYAIYRFPKIFLACSFGKDSRVLVDLALIINPQIEIVGMDTGYEFEETMEFAKQLTKELRMNFRWEQPMPEERQKIERDYAGSQVKNDQYICCEMKIPVAERMIGSYEAWITGLRRDETEFRKGIKLIEEGSTTKINPLAFWTKDDVWEYIQTNKLRYHPLYDEGYQSLGCELCTTQGKIHAGGGRQGQFERAGRFNGTAHQGGECGLHLVK